MLSRIDKTLLKNKAGVNVFRNNKLLEDMNSLGPFLFLKWRNGDAWGKGQKSIAHIKKTHYLTQVPQSMKHTSPIQMNISLS